MRDLYQLLQRLGSLRKYLFLLLLRSPVEGVRAWMMAGLMRSIFGCVEAKEAGELFGVCGIYLLLCGGIYLYNGSVWKVYAAFAAKLEVLLQKSMFRKMKSTTWQRLESRSGGEWITRLNSDVHGAFMLLNEPFNIPHAVVSTVNLTLSSVLLCRGSIGMFLLTWGFLVPHLFFQQQVVLKRMPILKKDSQKALADSTSVMEPLLTEADVILVYDAGDLMMELCEKSSLQLLKTNCEIHWHNALSNAMLRLLGMGGYVAMLLIGFEKIYAGSMPFSQLTYLFQMRGAVIAAVLMLATCRSRMKANAVCVTRLNEKW